MEFLHFDICIPPSETFIRISFLSDKVLIIRVRSQESVTGLYSVKASLSVAATGTLRSLSSFTCSGGAGGTRSQGCRISSSIFYFFGSTEI
jgi:hypothetical protein